MSFIISDSSTYTDTADTDTSTCTAATHDVCGGYQPEGEEKEMWITETLLTTVIYITRSRVPHLIYIVVTYK